MKKLFALLIIGGLLTMVTGCPPSTTSKTGPKPADSKGVKPDTTKPADSKATTTPKADAPKMGDSKTPTTPKADAPKTGDSKTPTTPKPDDKKDDKKPGDKKDK